MVTLAGFEPAPSRLKACWPSQLAESVVCFRRKLELRLGAAPSAQDLQGPDVRWHAQRAGAASWDRTTLSRSSGGCYDHIS